MIARLAKCIDWHALQFAAMLPSIRKCARGDSKLAEAVEFLDGPNFIPAESKPAELQFTSKIYFTFPSPRPCEFVENNIVPGRLYCRARDLLVEAELTEELWQKWKQPEIWRLPHGHISWMLTSGITGRVLDWLAPRLEAGQKNVGVGYFEAPGLALSHGLSNLCNLMELFHLLSCITPWKWSANVAF